MGNTAHFVKYGFAALLVISNVLIIMTGHSGDVGAATMLGLMGMAVTALLTSATVKEAVTRAANGVVDKAVDKITNSVVEGSGDRSPNGNGKAEH